MSRTATSTRPPRGPRDAGGPRRVGETRRGPIRPSAYLRRFVCFLLCFLLWRLADFLWCRTVRFLVAFLTVLRLAGAFGAATGGEGATWSAAGARAGALLLVDAELDVVESAGAVVLTGAAGVVVGAVTTGVT